MAAGPALGRSMRAAAPEFWRGTGPAGEACRADERHDARITSLRAGSFVFVAGTGVRSIGTDLCARLSPEPWTLDPHHSQIEVLGVMEVVNCEMHLAGRTPVDVHLGRQLPERVSDRPYERHAVVGQTYLRQ